MNETLKKIIGLLQAHDIDFWIVGQYKIGIKAEDCESMQDLIPLIGSFLSNKLNIKTCGYLDSLFVLDVKGIKLVWFYQGKNGLVTSKFSSISKEKMLELIEENKKLLNE